MESNVCMDCAWFIGEDGGFNCMAYPDGIPYEFVLGEALHDRVRKDQVDDYVFRPFFNEEDYDWYKPREEGAQR